MLRESTCGTRETRKHPSVTVTGALTVSYCMDRICAPQNCNVQLFILEQLEHDLVRFCDATHRPVGIIYPIHANFCYKSNSGGCLWVSRSTFHFQTVYPVLIIGLKNKEKHIYIWYLSNILYPHAEFPLLTLAGPMIMPVHRVRVMSSSSSRPQLTVPSPSPFCPSSSSSNKRKLRGTLTSKTTRSH